MHPSPIKQRIRESFDRAAATYDAAAVVQRRVCDRLLAEFKQPSPATPRRILDAGCGTGYAARLLRRRREILHDTLFGVILGLIVFFFVVAFAVVWMT